MAAARGGCAARSDRPADGAAPKRLEYGRELARRGYWDEALSVYRGLLARDGLSVERMIEVARAWRVLVDEYGCEAAADAAGEMAGSSSARTPLLLAIGRQYEPLIAWYEREANRPEHRGSSRTSRRASPRRTCGWGGSTTCSGITSVRTE